MLEDFEKASASQEEQLFGDEDGDEFTSDYCALDEAK
jgi:hypothetical protein